MIDLLEHTLWIAVTPPTTREEELISVERRRFLRHTVHWLVPGALAFFAFCGAVLLNAVVKFAPLWYIATAMVVFYVAALLSLVWSRWWKTHSAIFDDLRLTPFPETSFWRLVLAGQMRLWVIMIAIIYIAGALAQCGMRMSGISNVNSTFAIDICISHAALAGMFCWFTLHSAFLGAAIGMDISQDYKGAWRAYLALMIYPFAMLVGFGISAAIWCGLPIPVFFVGRELFGALLCIPGIVIIVYVKNFAAAYFIRSFTKRMRLQANEGIIFLTPMRVSHRSVMPR